MKLKLLKNKTNWVTFYYYQDGEKIEEPDIKFLIDYPTLEQQEHLDELYSLYLEPAKKQMLRARKQLDESLPEGEKSQIINDLAGEALIEADIGKLEKYKQHLVKYCIKGWEGLEETIKIIQGTKGSELEHQQWTELIRSKIQLNTLVIMIEEETRYNEIDKKK